jgi:hypothetical protein
MAIPAAPDWGASETITEAKLDSISAVLNFLLEPPRCYAYKSGTGALANSTWDAVNFGVEAYDSHGAHDNTTNSSRITAPESGLYTVAASVEFEANATGSRRINVRKNAAGVQTAGTSLRFVVVNAVAGAGNETTVAATFDTQLVQGDYIECFAHQSSGAALNVTGTLAGTFLSIRWTAKTV